MNTKQNFERQTLVEQILVLVGAISIGLGSLVTLFLFIHLLRVMDGPLADVFYRLPIMYIVAVLFGVSFIALSEVIKQIRLSNLQHYTQNPSHESSKKSSG